MKFAFSLISALALIGMTACQNSKSFKRVPDSAIDPSKLDLVTALTTKIMAAQAEGGSYQLQEAEAETRMIEAFTEKVQKDTYEQVSGALGTYQGLTFDHMVKPTDGTLYEIYRFRGLFQAENAQIEIRAVLNNQGKLAGFFIRPWQDEIN